MTEREKALVEAAKLVLRTTTIWPGTPWKELHDALKAYADCPECCRRPDLCAGTGRCPLDPVCNN